MVRNTIATWALLVGLVQIVAPAAVLPHGLPLEGEAAEHFLRTAEVVSTRWIGVGLTRPEQVTLTDGSITAKAVFKSVDVMRSDPVKMPMGVRDSFKHEIAAYELDKLLGLDLVPPTVERTIDGRRGSLQMWVEDCIPESERLQRDLSPPDLHEWNSQIFKVRLLRQLTADLDYNNGRNVLVDPNFRVYVIDSSLAFSCRGLLRRKGSLRHFSHEVLARLRMLSQEEVDARLGSWLSEGQIKGLMERSAEVVRLADREVARRGEVAVLY